MENYQKYEKSYFMPPVATYDWARKDSIEKPPIWCSVDFRDGNQALSRANEPGRKTGVFPVLVDIGFKEIEWDSRLRPRRSTVYAHVDRKEHDTG